MAEKQRLVVGISGASGAIYGIRMLEVLREIGVETHLVVSKAAQITIPQETDYTLKDVQALASKHYAAGDIAAAISSGSFLTMGMIVAPCSVASLSAIATGLSHNLLTRAADVMLKERRRLVLMVRETPLHTVHLRHMTTLSEMGAIIAPPVPAFYNAPESVDSLVDHTVARALDLFGLETGRIKRWAGAKPYLQGM